ncbi:adhesin, partial [Sebaldella sp. S0638]|nr:adhesin [Sebaldella sp. S0638]
MKKGKRNNFSRKSTAIGLLLGMLMNMISFSDGTLIKTRSGDTVRVITAPNGTPMIELANPNGAGISINEFDRLSVDERNLILNNISPKEGSVYRSELGGLIAPNENYSGAAARAVLIRVHNDPTVINGFIEAASTGKMDVFWTNPNGIYLNGGMVGRFGNVTFTTGRITDDLMTIMVRDGRIEIGTGFNGNAAESLSLLAKELKVNGQLNGNDMTLIGGQYDYNTSTKQIVKQGDNPNEVLVSASAVGSIYGQNIYLVAVGSDIGVKGDLISQKVLRINADGTVTTNKIQGTEGIEVKGKEFIQNTSTFTEGNLKIDADKAVLNGAGTQAGSIEITGDLENNVTLYAKNSITVGKDVMSKGQIIAEEGALNINGSLTAEELVYGNGIRVGKGLTNKSDMQSTKDIIIGLDVLNTGKLFSDKLLNIGGNIVNHGIVYGKDSIIINKVLNNSGSLQTTGDLTAKNTVNTGKLVAEGNISTADLDNNGEVIANGKLSSGNIDNKAAGKINTGVGVSTAGNVFNRGTVNTNGDFVIIGNLENYSVINAGGLLSARDLVNSGALKVSDKIVSRGNVFTNNGEMLTGNLDVDVSGNIVNTNKITVVETANLKGNNINNQGTVAANNIELAAPVLINSGQILASETITANNTSLTNTGKLASNSKIDLNNSSVINRNT